jgi:hypothetical protein
VVVEVPSGSTSGGASSKGNKLTQVDEEPPCDDGKSFGSVSKSHRDTIDTAEARSLQKYPVGFAHTGLCCSNSSSLCHSLTQTMCEFVIQA